MTIDHRAAAQVARETARDHAILHGSGASAAAKFAALERAQRGAETRGALVATAYLDVITLLPKLRRAHAVAANGERCSADAQGDTRGPCTCGADEVNAWIDAVLGGKSGS